MDVVEISGDHDDLESAQVTFRLCSTGDHVVVSLFKSNPTKAGANDGSGALPLIDHIILFECLSSVSLRTIGRSSIISTEMHSRQCGGTQ